MICALSMSEIDMSLADKNNKSTQVIMINHDNGLWDGEQKGVQTKSKQTAFHITAAVIAVDEFFAFMIKPDRPLHR